MDPRTERSTAVTPTNQILDDLTDLISNREIARHLARAGVRVEGVGK